VLFSNSQFPNRFSAPFFYNPDYAATVAPLAATARPGAEADGATAR
jgi:isopenicillin N synthase-like dioxygenase